MTEYSCGASVSLARSSVAVPPYPICGNRGERDWVKTAAACSMLAAAMAMSRLPVRASAIRASSSGSPYCRHQSMFAVWFASRSALAKVCGTSRDGRA
ncbi:hypothetical protein DSECCO2_475550 [anaerobic digester metagenome]